MAHVLQLFFGPLPVYPVPLQLMNCSLNVFTFWFNLFLVFCQGKIGSQPRTLTENATSEASRDIQFHQSAKTNFIWATTGICALLANLPSSCIAIYALAAFTYLFHLYQLRAESAAKMTQIKAKSYCLK
jgi:hypothetical protein